MMEPPNFQRKENTFLTHLLLRYPLELERFFGVLRRIKNFMRSTMSQERMSGWPQLAIERDVAS